MRIRTGVNWRHIKANLGACVSEEEARILDHLIAGKSTPEIAKLLHQHRSMIWRKVQAIRKRGDKPDAPLAG